MRTGALAGGGFPPVRSIAGGDFERCRALGMEDELGSVCLGKKADLVLVEGNPISNFKLLYGTGHMKLDRESGQVERVGGVSFTIRDGVVFDAKALLREVRGQVAAARER